MTHRHFMIDLETLGTSGLAAILSIGAVEFTLPFMDDLGFHEGLLGNQFYVNVDAQSCIDRGMLVDASTIEWWQDQSPEAQQALRLGKKNLHEALRLLANYLIPNDIADDSCTVWAHGDVFDIAILNNAYRLCNYKQTPWKYNRVRDARTVYDLTGVWPSSEHDDDGSVAHNALSDAKRQARAVIAGWRTIEKLKYDHILLFRKSVGYGEPADDILERIVHDEATPIPPAAPVTHVVSRDHYVAPEKGPLECNCGSDDAPRSLHAPECPVYFVDPHSLAG